MGVGGPFSFAGDIARLRGSGKVLITPSSPLKGLSIRGVGMPGAFDTAAIVGSAAVDTDFDTGRGAVGTVVAMLFDEECDRRRGKARWAAG